MINFAFLQAPIQSFLTTFENMKSEWSSFRLKVLASKNINEASMYLLS